MKQKVHEEGPKNSQFSFPPMSDDSEVQCQWRPAYIRHATRLMAKVQRDSAQINEFTLQQTGAGLELLPTPIVPCVVNYMQMKMI